MARLTLISAALAAALIALLVPATRDLLGCIAIGSILIVGNVQIGRRQHAQIRQIHARVERTRQQIAAHR